MAKSHAALNVLAIFKNGREIVVQFLMTNDFSNIKDWEREHFETFRLKLREFAKTTRETYGVNDKEFRKTFKKLEDEAVVYWNKLSNDILNNKTRNTMLRNLEIWQNNIIDKSWTVSKAQGYLENLLRNDHHEIESSEVTRNLLEGIAKKSHKQLGENQYPAIEGVSRRADGLEEWKHELIPLDRVKGLEERNRLRETDLLPEELDRLIKVPEFDQRQFEAALKYQSSLSDLDSDILAFLFADFCKKAKHQNDVVTISLNEIMSALHFQKYTLNRQQTNAVFLRLIAIKTKDFD
jgi:hypothetical protein